MRLPALTLLAIFTLVHAAAQPDAAGQRIIKKKCTTQHLSFTPDKYQEGYPGLFHDIRVLDLRRDTTRLGILRVNVREQNNLLFNSSATADLTAYLNSVYAKAGAPYSLLIVLKDLWISCPEDFVPRAHFEMNIAFHAEAYLKVDDGYKPILFLDSTAEKKGIYIPSVAEHGLRDLIDAFMYQLASADLTKNRRTVNLRQIDSFSRSRFDYSMDTATQFVKGVYANVEEFRNNAPSILKYEISKDGRGDYDLNIPDETGKLYLTHTVWGFSDGQQPYVMIDGSLFPVYRIGHQFYVLGSKEYRYRKLWLYMPIGPIEAVEDMVKTMRLFRLDPDSGKVIE